jgi:serine/threonine-protein kinase
VGPLPEARPSSAAPGGGPAPTPFAPDLFDAYLDDYFTSTASLSWADLVEDQNGLCASLAFGAAGIAYAHWYAGTLGGDEHLLAEADRWIRAALAGQRHRLAFLEAGARREDRMPPGAYLYGRVGLSFVRALVARSRDERQAERRALARFAELSRGAAAGTADLYRGIAGCLAATAILFQHLGDGKLLDLGAELSARLRERAVLDGRGSVTWNGLHGLGLAHGEAGADLALLLWSAASGCDLPPWFTPSLTALLDTARRSPEQFTRSEQDRSRLCKGIIGPAFLATRAAQLLGEPSFLAAARAIAAQAAVHLPDCSDLCCGRAGCAFALLPLAQQDPAGPWRKLSQELALSTLLCDRADWSLTGLFGGEAALPCLALNMKLGIASGPPCLDFIPAV